MEKIVCHPCSIVAFISASPRQNFTARHYCKYFTRQSCHCLLLDFYCTTFLYFFQILADAISVFFYCSTSRFGFIRRRVAVGRVPAFQPGGPGSIPGGVRNFNFRPWDWVCVLCVLSFVVSGGGPDIVLTTHSGRPALVYLSSVLIQRLLLPLQASGPRAFGL